jgi:hypothetical protein
VEDGCIGNWTVKTWWTTDLRTWKRGATVDQGDVGGVDEALMDLRPAGDAVELAVEEGVADAAGHYGQDWLLTGPAASPVPDRSEASCVVGSRLLSVSTDGRSLELSTLSGGHRSKLAPIVVRRSVTCVEGGVVTADGRRWTLHRPDGSVRTWIAFDPSTVPFADRTASGGRSMTRGEDFGAHVDVRYLIGLDPMLGPTRATIRLDEGQSISEAIPTPWGDAMAFVDTHHVDCCLNESYTSELRLFRLVRS